MNLQAWHAPRRSFSAWSRFSQFLGPVVFICLIAVAVQDGRAVIRVDAPITQTYDLAKLILVGSVARVDVDQKVVEVQVTKVLKGAFMSDRVFIQLAGVNDYILRVDLNQPAVIFVGLKGALVHLVDNFLSAEAFAPGQPPTLEVTKVNPIESRFPGRTVALVRLLNEIAEGRPTLLNIIEHVVWNGGIKKWGNALPNADYVVGVHPNGDGKADVLLGNSRSTELLVNTGSGLRDETLKRGLRNARGKWAASGDINSDGKIDLLIGRQFWLNEGRRFAPGPVLPLPSDTDFLAVALLDVASRGRPDAVFLKKDGELLVFENPGRNDTRWKALPPEHLWSGGEEAEAAAFSIDWGDTGKPHVMVVRATGLTRYALEADGGSPADFDRLTGGSLRVNNKMYGRARWDSLALVPLDINGDGRQDLIAVLDKGGVTLVNRGFGTFLLNPLATDAIFGYDRDNVPWKVTPKTRFGAGDLHGDKFDDLLIVTPEGKLFELNNTPYERTSNRFQ